MTPTSHDSDLGRTAAATATVVAGVMIAQQVAGKAVRDALFLSQLPAERLPPVMAAAAVISVVVVLAFTKLIVRYSPARVVPLLFVGHGALYVVEWAIARTAPDVAAVSVYVHSAALGATVISGFWSVINERFDPHTAKRFISRIAGGATAGGVLGGIVAWQAGQYLDIRSLLLLLTVVNWVAAYGTARVTRGAPAGGSRSRGEEIPPSGRGVMREVPYLRHVALLVLSVTLVEATIDYLFKAEVKSYFIDGRQLISFFAIFHAVCGLLTFVLQTTLAKRSLERLGLTGTVATLPITNILGAFVALFVPGVWPLVALRGTAMATENSLFRSGYELLFTPLTPDRKRPTKTLIDVGADRLGSLLGSALAFVVIWMAMEFVRPTLLVAAMIVATISLVVAGLLHRGYVSALADSLRRGALRIAPDAVEDATTRRTLADTAMALDRDKLLNEIAKLRQQDGDGVDDVEAVDLAGAADDEVARSLAALRTGRTDQIRAVFAKHRGSYPGELVATTIQLLARNELHHQVIDVLRRIVDQHVGQLCDALLDPGADFAIRRRIPRVLVRSLEQRAVDGLVAGLRDERFEVRYRCGMALYQQFRDRPTLYMDEGAIMDAALREAERGEHVWQTQKLVDSSLDDGEGPFVDGSEKVGRSLEHVFTILSLVLERDVLQLAYRALASDDPGLRGTGLEYLENVLPHEIRGALWPYLGDQRVTRSLPREKNIVAKELFSSMNIRRADIREAEAEAAITDAGGDNAKERAD